MFPHEKLAAYQRAIRFVAWSQAHIDSLPACALREQWDRASTSIPLHIAEGSAEFSKAERSRFLQIAQGSVVECAACIDVAVSRGIRTAGELEEGKTMLVEIARMVAGLLARLEFRMDEPGSESPPDEEE